MAVAGELGVSSNGGDSRMRTFDEEIAYRLKAYGAEDNASRRVAPTSPASSHEHEDRVGR